MYLFSSMDEQIVLAVVDSGPCMVFSAGKTNSPITGP